MLKVGFYEKEITPPLGDDIPGYSGPRTSTTIHDPLFTRAISVRTGEAVYECVIIVSLDLIGVPDTLYDFVLEKVENWTGVPQKNIMITATHSHTAGPIRDTSPADFRILDEEWLKVTSNSAADAAIMAYQKMVDATAEYASTTVEGLSFCRDFLLKDGEIRTNPKWHDPNIVKAAGANDTEFNVVFFKDEAGKPFGAIANFACHHDSKAGREISADYSGVVSDKMKDVFGRKFVNLFLQGFCGNLNHCNPFREKLAYDKPAYQRIGEELAKEEEALYGNTTPLDIYGVYSEKRLVAVPKREIPENELEEALWARDNLIVDWYQMDINKPENMMFKRTHATSLEKLHNAPSKLPYYVQVIRLGDLSIYAMPGEPYVEFQLMLKEKSPTKYNMFSGTSLKGHGGYIPTPEMFGTKSYAVAFGSSPVAPEAGEMLVDVLIEAAGEIDEQVRR